MKYFCDAVKLGGITASAKANFVTQSAVSQGITKLEKAIDCSLLARHPNQFRLTPEGHQAFQQMSEILRKTTELQENFSQFKTIGDLEFACTFSCALALVPEYLKKFKQVYPQSKVNLQCSGNPDEIKRMLTIGLLDFAILVDIGDFSGFEQRVIYNGNYGLYKACTVKKKEEGKLGFILTKPEDIIHFEQAYFRKYDKPPVMTIGAKSWIIGANLVAQGLGIGYFPDYIALRKKQELRPCDLDVEFPTYKLYAIYLKGMKLRKSSEIFLSYFS